MLEQDLPIPYENSDSRVSLIASTLRIIHGDEWLEIRKIELDHLLNSDSTWEDYVRVSLNLGHTVPIEAISNGIIKSLNYTKEMLDDLDFHYKTMTIEQMRRVETFRDEYSKTYGLVTPTMRDVFLHMGFAEFVDESLLWSELFPE